MKDNNMVPKAETPIITTAMRMDAFLSHMTHVLMSKMAGERSISIALMHGGKQP